jgi:hypothetical protein
MPPKRSIIQIPGRTAERDRNGPLLSFPPAFLLKDIPYRRDRTFRRLNGDNAKRGRRIVLRLLSHIILGDNPGLYVIKGLNSIVEGEIVQ